jgi:hypothetical protein
MKCSAAGSGGPAGSIGRRTARQAADSGDSASQVAARAQFQIASYRVNQQYSAGVFAL